MDKREKEDNMRIALLGIIVKNREEVEKLNDLLHEYSEYILGRMGVPYKEKDVSIISIAMNAPQDKISALSGKIGMIKEFPLKLFMHHRQFIFVVL